MKGEMMKKTNKGFTLIELLAVIVILAIIALIATPTILGVIEKARKGSAESSALGYIDAVEKQIAINVLDSSKTNIVDAVYETDDLNSDIYGVNVKGNKPETTSWVKIEKNQVVDYSLKIGNYIVNYNSETKTAKAVKGDTVNTKPEGGSSVPAPVSFATDSWATIQKAVESGTYPYEIGNTKTVDMGDLGTHTVRVANTSSCTNGETSETACGFVIEFADIITDYAMNSTGTNVGGWPASGMKDYLNNTVLSALPSDLQSVIIDTTVVSGHGSTSNETNFISTDKLYLLSTKEVWNGGTGVDTAESETRQLDYYANYENEDGTKGVTISNYAGAIKQNNGTDLWWWMRSSISDSDELFARVLSDGTFTYSTAANLRGVSPAFRIG